MVKHAQDLDFVLQHLRGFDEPLVDHLDAPFRVGWLLERGLVNGPVSTSSNGLNKLVVTLW